MIGLSCVRMQRASLRSGSIINGNKRFRQSSGCIQETAVDRRICTSLEVYYAYRQTFFFHLGNPNNYTKRVLDVKCKIFVYNFCSEHFYAQILINWLRSRIRKHMYVFMQSVQYFFILTKTGTIAVFNKMS